MYLPNCKLEFEGKTPSNKTNRLIASLLKTLQNASPTDSALHLRLKLEDTLISGVLSVKSVNANFDAQSSGKDIMAVTKNLINEIFQQLKVWSGQRQFHD